MFFDIIVFVIYYMIYTGIIDFHLFFVTISLLNLILRFFNLDTLIYLKFLL